MDKVLIGPDGAGRPLVITPDREVYLRFQDFVLQECQDCARMLGYNAYHVFTASDSGQATSLVMQRYYEASKALQAAELYQVKE